MENIVRDLRTKKEYNSQCLNSLRGHLKRYQDYYNKMNPLIVERSKHIKDDEAKLIAYYHRVKVHAKKERDQEDNDRLSQELAKTHIQFLDGQIKKIHSDENQVRRRVGSEIIQSLEGVVPYCSSAVTDCIAGNTRLGDEYKEQIQIHEALVEGYEQAILLIESGLILK